MPRRNNRTKPNPRPPRPTSCSSKRAYPSKIAAQRAIDECQLDDVVLSCYLCSSCGKWHLTSQSR